MNNAQVKTLVKGHIAEFRNFANAERFANRCIKIHMIVMGDHDDNGGKYWVVTPADAQRLERAGYEMA